MRGRQRQQNSTSSNSSWGCSTSPRVLCSTIFDVVCGNDCGCTGRQVLCSIFTHVGGGHECNNPFYNKTVSYRRR